MPFSAWLRKNRKDRKYSQYRLADASGIARAYIGRMEKDGAVSLPTPETREKLHAVFGTSDQTLVDDGVAEWHTFRNAEGEDETELIARVPSIASDAGEIAAITATLETLPDEALQHLRRFLEAMRHA